MTFSRLFLHTHSIFQKGTEQKQLLIDNSEIVPLPKIVRPIADQDGMESRRLWQSVTQAIKSKQYGLATKNKQSIEQAQRDLKEERERTQTEHKIAFFDDDARKEAGRPRLSAKGQEALKAELEGKGYAHEDVPTELVASLRL